MPQQTAIDYTKRHIAAITEDGEIFESIEALKEWEAWALEKAEKAMQGGRVSNAEALDILNQWGSNV